MSEDHDMNSPKRGQAINLAVHHVLQEKLIPPTSVEFKLKVMEYFLEYIKISDLLQTSEYQQLRDTLEGKHVELSNKTRHD